MKSQVLQSALLWCALALIAGVALAQPTAPAKPDAADKHRQEDIAKHRKLAQAHEAAARCLESGEKEAVCYEKMRATCLGIAIGKYCGMKHSH